MCNHPASFQNSKISQQICHVLLRACRNIQTTQPILIDLVIHYGTPKLNLVVSLWFLFYVEHTEHLTVIMLAFSESSKGILFKKKLMCRKTHK
jgi:hypothetical protein